MNMIVLIIGIILIAYYVALTAVMGSVVFSYIILLIGIVMTAWYFADKKLMSFEIYLKVKRIAMPLIAIGLAVFIIGESVIAGFALNKNTEKSDYLIILGAGLRGSVMSMTLRQRMEDSYKYLKEHDNGEYIVVTGGQGPGESIPEAEAMMRYLLDQGIPSDRIIKEDKSTTTSENLEFAKMLIEEHSGKKIGDVSVKIATSGFHSLRAYLLARSIGYEQITSYGCRINPIFIPVYYLREFAAMTKTFVIDPVLGWF